MSATATPPPQTATAAPDAMLREPRISLLRLARVELRKAYDTRAGFWLLATIALVSIALVVLTAVGGDFEDRTFVDYFHNVNWPVSILLPVLGILLITSEWSQRSALTTFTLVPDRWRVVVAKLLALTALTIGAIAVSIVAAAIGNVVGGGDGSWSFGVDTLGEVLVFQLVGMFIAFAFGLVFLSSALAIVLYFVLPTIWSILVNVIPGLEGAAEWLDLGQTTTPLNEGGGPSGEEWAQLGTSVALWLLVPLAIGLWRLARAEVK
jgi:ABC-2 type transport system permease protein